MIRDVLQRDFYVKGFYQINITSNMRKGILCPMRTATACVGMKVLS